MSWLHILFDDFDTRFIDCKGVRMNWCLRDEAVGHWEANNASNESCKTQEKEIPVKASWLLKGKLARLCSETAHILEK